MKVVKAVSLDENLVKAAPTNLPFSKLINGLLKEYIQEQEKGDRRHDLARRINLKQKQKEQLDSEINELAIIIEAYNKQGEKE